MLLGRGDECGRIDRLLAKAETGASAVLVIRGEAGIGKSALLRYAIERGRAMRTLTAQGVDAESELPFSGLADILRPILGDLERIPEGQAAALRGALALGPPAAGDRFRIAAATLSLLAVAAEERPLIAAIDDAHWLDAASAEALLFTARRLDVEGIVLLLAVRDGEWNPFDLAGLPELRLSGLDLGASKALLARQSARAVAPMTVETLFHATRGNPLALIEVAGLLTDAQLAGTEPLEEPLPAGAGIEAAFLRRVGGLQSESQHALLVAAASASSEMDEITGAARRLGVDPAAFAPAETAGLVTIDGRRLEWRHPLLRSAVYHAAPAAERRAAHQALAGAIAGDRRAWHLSAAALAPDEETARALENAAVSARGRSGHAAAARAFERAAELTPGVEDRARRLLEAARDYHLLGRSKRALECVDKALASGDDPLLRADLQLMRGQVLMWGGRPAAAHESLRVAAVETKSIDRARAAIMLAEAALACTMTGDVRATLEIAERAHELAHRAGTAAEAYAAALLGNALLLCGRGEEGYPLLLQTRMVFEEGDPLAGAPLIHSAGHGSMWVEDYAEARHVFESVIEAARGASAGGLLSFPLACLSELDFRTGRWASAYAGASEALRLAEEAGQDSQTSFSLTCLARVEAALGRQKDCRAHVARARELAELLGAGSILSYAGSVLGLLEVGLGKPEKAIRELEVVARLVEAHGLEDPSVVQWAPDLIEAYARVARVAEARDALARFEDQAERSGRTWALAAAARCRGLLADGDDFEEHFESAVHWHERTPTPFERARTELALGERLRRAKRPADARVPLRSALETFERLGASPWAEHARAELAASGERERRPRPSGLERLTPQELQIALLVAEGATNREAATTLFLSPKTVEYHLGKTYEKLGVRSRTELAGLLARESRSLQSA